MGEEGDFSPPSNTKTNLFYDLKPGQLGLEFPLFENTHISFLWTTRNVPGIFACLVQFLRLQGAILATFVIHYVGFSSCHIQFSIWLSHPIISNIRFQ